MLYKSYGKTGKQISAIAAGGMRLPNPAHHEDGVAVFLKARALGINYFDTAPIYCDDQSESILGEALKAMPISTEYPTYTSSKSGADNASDFRKGLEKSLARLQIPQITFFHIWCVMNPEDWQSRLQGGVLAEALKAKEEGLINHICVSTHMKGADIEALIDQHPEIEGLTLGYCAMNFPYRQQGVDAARRNNIGVVAMNPLGGGIIPQNPNAFSFLRGPEDPDVVTGALRFVVSDPGITAALVGFGSVQDVVTAVDAVENFTPHVPERLKEIRSAIEQEFNEMCTGCGYCLPCPQDIPIPKYMDVYNHIQLKDTPEALNFRLRFHWDIPASGASKCIQCGLCESRCTQHLNIIERLKVVADIPPLP